MELINVLVSSRRELDANTIIFMAKIFENYIFEDVAPEADKAKVPADLPKVGSSTGKKKT
jgi:hypothetical protein